MLPKVANQILHHTSRAVAAVQNQTGQTIRNVLQLQSSSGPSSAAGNLGAWNSTGSSSSGWGSSGPGAGGAKQSSSRFYSSYSSVGRAATLVDPSFSHAANVDSFDDPDETLVVAPLRARHRQRQRSSSLSFTVQDRDDQAGRIGVLKTIQLHVRARHAFAAPPPQIAGVEDAEVHDEQRTVDASDLSDVREREAQIAAEEKAFATIFAARQNADPSVLLAEVQKLRDMVPPPVPAVWNAALQALVERRKPGQSIQNIVKTYHDMISRSVVPNFRTYVTLIEALTVRDVEVVEEIRSIETRIRTRQVMERAKDLTYMNARLDQLKTENAFGAALTLFQAASVIPRAQFPLNTYISLLRSCAERGNVDAAIHVYAHLEKQSNLLPPAAIFKDLIRAYKLGGDLPGAKEVFDEYRTRAQSGRIMATEGMVLDVPVWRMGSINVWNEMIDTYFHFGQPAAALALLEQMMDTPKGLDFTLGDIPLPSSNTFAYVIRGFIRAGDVSTASAWFHKLLGQKDKPVNSNHPTLNPTQPDGHAWISMVEALVANDMFDELTEIIRIANEANMDMSYYVANMVLRAYIHRFIDHPELLGPETVEILDLLRGFNRSALPAFVSKKVESSTRPEWLHSSLIKLYLQCERPDRALELLEECVPLLLEGFEDGREIDVSRHAIRTLLITVSANLIDKKSIDQWSLENALRLLRQHDQAQIPIPRTLRAGFLRTYERSTSEDKDRLTVQDWAKVIESIQMVFGPVGTDGTEASPMGRIFADIVQRNVQHQLSPPLLRLIAQSTTSSEINGFLAQAGDETWANIIRQGVAHEAQTSIDASKPPHVRIDMQHARYVDEYYPNNSKVSPLVAFSRFENGARRGIYPTPEVIAKLISSLGRLGELEKVRKLYHASQDVLAALEDNKHWQSSGWFGVEDAMIIALAHAGDADGAHIHRARILEQGGSPTADAYGALIQCVKDTTDDTSNAMVLFQEALSRGVAPNIYLYNTAISKLAKARKADHALSLFQEMKVRGIRPTSVTYGAVIAACCRVGDAQSAEVLFQEMSSQSNFRPRVPPYNTMMQLYTHTKPDRERVLYYYNALLAAKVQPTAHTYKLLIDAFGTIEPVDMDAMEETFNKLVADPQVPVQGTHWAALINAWGCVRKDLDRAVAVFESIQNHISTQQSHAKLPDAVVFEALMNVLVTLRRADLIPVYTEKLASYGVHMTAYIANLLIKGYAATGDIERAREVFESLSDPPEGVAAPNNHAPHDNEPVLPSFVPSGAPVYREPSTWEAMVRAELGNGNRDQAVALLERVQARRFPYAVYNRISGIMLDDSVSPWVQTPESSVSDSASS